MIRGKVILMATPRRGFIARTVAFLSTLFIARTGGASTECSVCGGFGHDGDRRCPFGCPYRVESFETQKARLMEYESPLVKVGYSASTEGCYVAVMLNQPLVEGLPTREQALAWVEQLDARRHEAQTVETVTPIWKNPELIPELLLQVRTAEGAVVAAVFFNVWVEGEYGKIYIGPGAAEPPGGFDV